MKNVLLFMCTVSICALGFSQMTSKNGHTILPEAGDWSIQMNAQPLLNMALNAVNIMDFNPDHLDPLDEGGYVKGFSQVLVGKYFKSDQCATRYKIALNSMSTTNKFYDEDPTTEDDGDDVLFAKEKTAKWELKLGYGHEYRRGHNRLQGIYGYEGMLILGNGGTNTSRDYEFAYTDMDEDIDTLGEDEPFAGEENEYVGSFFNSHKNGMSIGLEARAFIGVEYFFAPKMSVGAEFGWGFLFNMSGREAHTYTEEDDDNWVENEYLGNSENSFELAVDNMDAALSISFHF
tara:strand:+ start:1210 stop:2079 length:870 start_codon:yes stop_codon:yes gene_type:complete